MVLRVAESCSYTLDGGGIFGAGGCSFMGRTVGSEEVDRGEVPMYE